MVTVSGGKCWMAMVLMMMMMMYITIRGRDSNDEDAG